MLENIMSWVTNGKVTPGTVLFILLIYSIFLWIKNKLNISRDRVNNSSARKMQIESYFKQQGGEDQRKIYIAWVNLLINLEEVSKKYDDKAFKELKEKTTLYGSEQTVKILSSYSHYVYIHEGDNNEYTYMGIVYFAYIAASLKHDFTGYDVDPLVLIRLQFTDYDDLKDKFLECKRKIDWDIRWNWKQVSKGFLR